MNVFFISALVSPEVLTKVSKQDKTFNGYAVQKFNRLIVEGFSGTDNKVIALSTFSHFKRDMVKNVKETNDDTIYKYIQTSKNALLRFVQLFFCCFFQVLRFGFTKRNEKIVVCDVLNVSACIGALVASKLVGLRCVGVMTDMPGLMVHDNPQLKIAIASKVNKSYLSKFTHYVFLTEQMNEVVNTKHKPYIVMEGLVDRNIEVLKSDKRTKAVLYAGGLKERYGIKMLVEGFMKANVEGWELWLYGSGPFVPFLQEYEKEYPNIHYYGIKPNEEIVEAEQRASVLVNPRPTHEEFAKYSFPSKNMEYMVSGTPVLTTRLPGMPSEYYSYVYMFDEESDEGYARKLKEVLSKTEQELKEKGEVAQKWVLANKNNVKQAHRIIELVNR